MTTYSRLHALIMTLVVPVATLALCTMSFAQDPPAPAPTPESEAKAPIELLPGGEGAEEDTPLKVLGRIGETLREVESLMSRLTFDAEAAGGQEKVLDDIDKLLEQTGDGQQQVLGEIDKLINMAQQQQCKSGNFSPQSLSKPPKSQQEQQQNEQQEQGQKQESQAQQDPKNEKKDGESGEPENPNDSKGDPKNGKKPTDPAAEKSWNKDINGRWGSLPPKLQELIRQGDPSKFPPQYREMLEEYYKRLSDKDT